MYGGPEGIVFWFTDASGRKKDEYKERKGQIKVDTSPPPKIVRV